MKEHQTNGANDGRLERARKTPCESRAGVEDKFSESESGPVTSLTQNLHSTQEELPKACSS